MAGHGNATTFPFSLPNISLMTFTTSHNIEPLVGHGHGRKKTPRGLPPGEVVWSYVSEPAINIALDTVTPRMTEIYMACHR